jgi:hypothetical protein
VFEGYDDATLRTYEDVIAEMHGRPKPADGLQTLIAQSQKYGG